ncbi:MAG: hypothetical protein IKV87_06565 [Methanobrevibacter sp.]|nr:hypothetical protein [Methanobrevibacter sp.]
MTNESDLKRKLKDMDFDTEFQTLDEYKENLFDLNQEFFNRKAALNKLIEENYEYSSYNYDRLLNILFNLEKMFNKEYKSTLSIIQLAYKNNVVIDQVLKNKMKSLKSIIDKTSALYDDLVLNLNLSDSNTNQMNISVVKSMDSLIDSVKYYK